MDLPVSKKRKVDEELDLYALANDQVLELSEGMRMLKLDADTLTDQLPESLPALKSSLDEHIANAVELKERLSVAELRSRLDPDHIQSDEQFGINPLYLTEKFALRNNKQQNFISEMNVSVDAKWIVETVLVGNVCFEETTYRDLNVNVTKFLNYTDNKKTPHVYICPFSPVCDTWSPTTTLRDSHLRSHFHSPLFVCFYCDQGMTTKSNFVVHLAVCAPNLTAAEITAVADLGKSKALVYSDFQAIARQLWASGVVDLESMEQVSGQEKAQLVCFQKFSYQPILNFSAPETFLDCLRSYSCAHAEFENVLDKICARCPAGNSGKAYAVFEVTDGILTVQGAPSKAVYIGSECEAGRAIGHNKTRHRSFIEDSSRKSTSFHGKIRIAKQAGRRFKFFDILAGIRSDYRVPTHELEQLRFDVEKDKWDRPRHSVEDAFKTMFGALSDNLWNVNTVSRNRNNDTYEWPTEKRLLFGFYIFRRQWQTIADGLADNDGII